MMQAIEVKYLPQTETRGARMQAEARAGKVTISLNALDYDRDEEAEEKTAQALSDKFQWGKVKPAGRLKNGRAIFYIQ